MPSAFCRHCKKCVNTSIFCHQRARNAVFYKVFLPCFQKHWYLQCFVHLWSKKYWYLQHCLLFCIAPARDVKAQKCCNLQHFVAVEKSKFVKKCALLGQLGPFLGLMLGHLDPKNRHRINNMVKPQNAVKRSIFLRRARGRRRGAPPPFLLRRRKKAYGCDTACRGPRAPGRMTALFKGLRPTAGQGPT